MNKRKRRAGGFLKNSQLLVPLIAILLLVVFNLIRDPGFFSVGLTTNNNGDPVLQGNLISILNGASELILSAEVSGDMNLGLAGASKGKLTFKGGILRTVCTGASKLHAEVNCRKLNANCDGASKTDFSGTADEVEIDRSGVAVNIDTTHLNQF